MGAGSCSDAGQHQLFKGRAALSALDHIKPVQAQALGLGGGCFAGVGAFHGVASETGLKSTAGVKGSPGLDKA